MEFILIKILPFLKDFLPWFIVLGGIVKWWYSKNETEESLSLSRIETFSKVEERLRESLQKQLEVTEIKLEAASKEIEKMKVLLVKYQIEIEQLKAELGRHITPKS